MEYSDKHKQFLQFFMRERIIPEKDAKTINNILFPEIKLDDTIELINTKINFLDFKINKVVCEQNGELNYVFIALFIDDFNAKSDQNKLIFGEIFNHIISTGGCISYDQLININSQISDSMINDFFAQKYLLADKDKNIFLSPLAMSELEGYLIRNFEEKRCVGCLNVVGHGVECQSCGKFAHEHCLALYFKNVGSKKCPKCSKKLCTQWNPITTFNKL